MSSDRLGKYRERPTRSRTPYSRPKGLIRRVTDSVSGLLGSSWIPGFLRSEEEEEQQVDGGQRQRASSEQNHHTNHQAAGPSGFTRPVANSLQLSPRSLAAIYPEEAGGDASALAVAGPSSQTVSSSSNSTAAGAKSTYNSSLAATTSLGQDPLCNLGEINFSELIPETGFREKYRADQLAQQQLFSTPLSSGNGHHYGVSSNQTQTDNDTLQFSSGGASTAMPYPNETSLRATQGTSLQFSFQQQVSSQTEASGKNQHLMKQTTASNSPARVSTRQQQQHQTPASAVEVDDTVSTPSSRLSSAQSASKRPRFSLAAYNAAATPVGNKSILSDGSFRSSPFYPGRTIYGGAAAYRRTPTPVTPNRSATASPHLGAPTSDAGLSQAAQRILTCLNAMSTPLADAKRIPTPSASPYASYLDSPYTAAFHKHRPNRPPTSALNTPAKVGIQSNLSQYVLPPRASVNKSTGANKADNDSFLDPAASSAISASQQPSIFSVAAASASRSSATSGCGSASVAGNKASSSTSVSAQQTISNTNPLLQPRKQDSLDGSRSLARQGSDLGITSSSVGISSSSFAGSQQPAMFSFGGASDNSVSSGGGKMKSEKHRQRSSARLDGHDEMIVAPALPNAGLPKMNFSIPFAFTDGPSKSHDAPSSSANTASSPPSGDKPKGSCSGSAGSSTLDGFKFSVPEVLGTKKGGATSGDNMSVQFKFSAPASVLSSAKDNFVISESSFVPKVKSSSPIKNNSIQPTRELITNPGGLLDFLNKSSTRGDDSSKNSGVKSGSLSKECSSGSITSPKSSVTTGWGDKFKVSPGSWECGVCLVRNKAEDCKCVSCETAKPGASNTTQVALVAGASSNNIIGANKEIKSGFGDLFKKSPGDWDCSTCMLRNKSASEKCISCQAVKPGSKSSSNETPSTNSFSFGVKSAPLSTNTSTVTFGVPSSTVGSSSNSKAATTGFTFGITPVSSSSSFGASATSVFGGTKDASSKVNSTTTTTSSINKDNLKEKPASEPITNTIGFGSAFKKAPGEWECSMCLVNNKASATKCISCETAKPGAAPAKQTPAASAPSISTPAAPVMGFGDKFKKAPGDWECEVCMVGNKAPSTKCLACESPKPGSAVDSSKAVTGNFSFGTSAKSNEASAFKFGVSSGAGSVPAFGTSTSTASGFSFGGASSTAPASTATLPTLKPAPAVENGKAEFSFGVKSTTTTSNGSVSFGASIMNNKNSDVQAASPSPSNFTFTGSSTPTSLKTKPTQSPNKTTPALSSGSVLDFLKNSSEKPSENTVTPKKDVPSFSFGAKSSAAKTNESGSTSNSLPSFNFGSSQSSNQTSTIFGGAGTTSAQSNNSSAKPASIFPSFNSVSSTATTTPIKTSNKRTLDDADDSSTNGKRNSTSFSKNNGIAEPSSTFSFGKPSGGAPATAPPPMFQFGGPVAAAKPVPAFGANAFGGAPAPNFINNNTISNDTTGAKQPAAAAAPVFAFGKPKEKKQSASFDFGQAPASVPSYNFTQAAPAPTFQFTQSNDSGASGNNGIFQFGNAPASAANSVTPSFGGPSNPFSQTPSGTPAGRVVKRAIRRTKK